MRNSMQRRGFTLIEMMVAVGLFVVVALISTAALIAMSAALRRAQNVRTVIEATGIAMDSMTLRMVTKSSGSKFLCPPAYGTGSCVDFTTKYTGIQFSYGGTTYRYDYDSTNKKITFIKNALLSVDLTPPTISVDDLAFYVQNNNTPKISNVTILMQASAKADPSASAIIQTSIVVK